VTVLGFRKGQRVVAKILVACELTIFGLGFHSATGEEWADDDNAVTSAEAQAFKRACTCFGLGPIFIITLGHGWTWMIASDRR
jgi:hypothetical protein